MGQLQAVYQTRGGEGLSPSPAVVPLLRRAIQRQVAVVVAIEHCRIVDHRLPSSRGGLDVVRQLARKPAAQTICVRDDRTDRRGIGAVRDVQLGRDELADQGQAGILSGGSLRESQQFRMNGVHITKAMTITDGRVLSEQPDGSYRLAESQTDWARLDAMTEEEVEWLAAEDMAELGMDPDWMEHATVLMPRPKERVTVRLDPDVLDWLKAQGRGYQTRINAILRAYYTAQKAKSGGASPTLRG